MHDGEAGVQAREGTGGGKEKREKKLRFLKQMRKVAQ